MPDIHRYFVLDQNNINELSDNFIILLGGFLVDGQTFIIKTENTAVNEMITAFNLMQGNLPQISNPSTDTLFSNRINNILISFSDDNVFVCKLTNFRIIGNHIFYVSSFYPPF